MLLAVFRNMGYIQFGDAPWGEVSRIFTRDLYAAANARSQPGLCFHKLALTIALDAGHAEDLARVYLN